MAIVYKCNKRAKVEMCADVKEMVDIKKCGDYCKMCYRKQGNAGTKAQKKKKCNTSRLGWLRVSYLQGTYLRRLLEIGVR